LGATSLTMTVVVPANVTASISIPSTNLANIAEGGAAATSASGVLGVRTANGAAIFRVGSGTYNFTASPITF
jgi:alpha-L-rhamnosidase